MPCKNDFLNDLWGQLVIYPIHDLDQILSHLRHYAWLSLTVLQDYSGDHLWSGRTTIQVYFQNFMDFMGSSYPQKNYPYCVRVIRLCHQNVWPQNDFHFPSHKNFKLLKLTHLWQPHLPYSAIIGRGKYWRKVYLDRMVGKYLAKSSSK